MNTILFVVSLSDLQPNIDALVTDYLGAIPAYAPATNPAYETVSLLVRPVHFDDQGRMYSGYMYYGTVAPNPMPNCVHLVMLDHRFEATTIKKVLDAVTDLVDGQEIVLHNPINFTDGQLSLSAFGVSIMQYEHDSVQRFLDEAVDIH